jgi:hypothetical protein
MAFRRNMAAKHPRRGSHETTQFPQWSPATETSPNGLASSPTPILANSALDRLANGAHQVVIEGPSYRAKLAPRAPWEPPMK